MFEQKYEKHLNFLFENFHFWVVKFSVYLNRHVFVMIKVKYRETFHGTITTLYTSYTDKLLYLPCFRENLLTVRVYLSSLTYKSVKEFRSYSVSISCFIFALMIRFTFATMICITFAAMIYFTFATMIYFTSFLLQ